MGLPLSPYVHGLLVVYFRSRLSIRDITLPPKDLLGGKGDFLERSVLRGWMEEWLHYLHWYCHTCHDPWVTLEDFLDNKPMLEYRWNANRNSDENLIKLGLLWKGMLYVDSIGRDYRPGILVPLGGLEPYLPVWRKYIIFLEQLEGLGRIGPDPIGWICGI